ncbi:MAG TPA: tetratricopeptide repeat protein, partial [Syntrophales bacterium]
MGRKRIRQGKHLHLFIACVILAGICGCSGLQGTLARPDYWQADHHLAGGDYQAALKQYREITELYPQAADEALFGMGCLYAHPRNPQRDYQKSLDAFRRVVNDYPRSKYREPAEALLSVVGEAASQNSQAASQKKQVEALEKQLDVQQKQIEGLQKQIEQMKEIDRSLEEKR